MGANPGRARDGFREAASSGYIDIELRPHVGTAPAPAEVATSSPSSNLSTPTKLSWYEITVIDEVGEPLADTELEFQVSGQKKKRTTDGNGKARLDQVPDGIATVAFTSETDVRAALRERWEEPRQKEWTDANDLGAHTEVKVRRLSPLPSTTVFSEEPHTLVLQPRVVQAILHGMWFDTSKSFLLPTALPGVRFVTGLYKENRGTDLLVVGHTDTLGTPSYNDPLSLERAKAVVAYLKNDPAAWLDWYGAGKASEKRWGAVEDDLMIRAVTAERGETIDGSPIRYYQKTRGLTVDGVAGPQTRTKLLGEYMALAETSVPEDVACKAHGCGENFPLDPTADGTPDQQNRSVEVFFFDNPIAPPDKPSAVLPEPPGDNSKPGALEYPEWLLRAKEALRHLVTGRVPDCHVSLLLRSNSGQVSLVGRSFRLHLGDGGVIEGKTGDDGLVEADNLFAGDYLFEVDGVSCTVPALPREVERRLTRVPGYYLA